MSKELWFVSKKTTKETYPPLSHYFINKLEEMKTQTNKIKSASVTRNLYIKGRKKYRSLLLKKNDDTRY